MSRTVAVIRKISVYTLDLDMGNKKYPQPLSSARFAADVVVFTVSEGVLQVLLIERFRPPFEELASLPGGFVWEGETSLQAAQRVLLAKAGVEDVFIEQLYTFDSLERDPRGHTISVTYYALVPHERLVIHDGPDTRRPFLAPADKLPPLAFDHKAIIVYASGRLRSKVAYSNAIHSLLPPTFTFSQLQATYESILGTKLDKGNFRKKYLSLGLVEPTEERLVGTSYRPPQLYRFKHRTSQQLPAPFL
jgi:8-oxo-dGTP diphosphatase